METVGSSKDLVPIYKIRGVISQKRVTFIATTVRNYLIAEEGNFKIRPVSIVRKKTCY
jgi:hypothetical protein